SSYEGKHGNTDWWQWAAYIECTPPDSLDDIDYVEYHLHPSFRNPVQRIRKKASGFPLRTSGWGTFELKARVVFKDEQRESLVLSHYLTLGGAAEDNDENDLTTPPAPAPVAASS
ncbi:MAG: pYEATS domain-containing protein, partial [Pyrinomonadaceae bacterium]